MVEVGEVSLAAAERALRHAGFEPVVRDAPSRFASGEPQLGAWVPMPGEDAYAIVTLGRVVPGERVGTWSSGYNWTAPNVVTGYHVGFHERPFRTRGHGYGSPAGATYSVFVEDVVATVRGWSDWESTWSVIPVVEPATKRTARLRRLAASRTGGAEIPVGIQLDPLLSALLEPGQAASLHGVLDELFLPGIRWRFPRDRTGSRLATRVRVLLHEVAPPSHPAGRGVWLVVDGPAPRTEQRLTIALAQVVGKGVHLRWDRTPEYWRTAPRTLEELWGIGPEADAAFVGDVVDRLLAGAPLEALSMCGVTVDRGTRRLLAGLPDSYALREWTDKWVTNATTLMTDAAPWRWHDAVAPKQRPQRLESLGGFNPNRRPGLFLESHAGTPHLTFDQSASPLVNPRPSWARDPDYDLVRLGLIFRDQIPMPPPPMG